ncbi:MAG: hypothetical protein ACU85V_17355, partial [Gammaproteobacteria bacterium]
RAQSSDQPMEYGLEFNDAEDHCSVRLSGRVTLERSRTVLRQVWDDPRYAATRSAVWDFSACSDIPDLNALLSLARFIAREKQGRGASVVAFVGPGFGSSLFASAFRGLERIVGFDTNFFSGEDEALDWIASRVAA